MKKDRKKKRKESAANRAKKAMAAKERAARETPAGQPVKEPQKQAPMNRSVAGEFAGGCKERPECRRRTIYPGDQVIMTNRYDVPNEIKGIIWIVLGSPKDNGGKQCVQLEGYEGVYPVDGLKVVG